MQMLSVKVLSAFSLKLLPACPHCVSAVRVGEDLLVVLTYWVFSFTTLWAEPDVSRCHLLIVFWTPLIWISQVYVETSALRRLWWFLTLKSTRFNSFTVSVCFLEVCWMLKIPTYSKYFTIRMTFHFLSVLHRKSISRIQRIGPQSKTSSTYPDLSWNLKICRIEPFYPNRKLNCCVSIIENGSRKDSCLLDKKTIKSEPDDSR